MIYRKNPKSNLSAIAILISITAVALWQFYVFVTFKDARGALDVEGGSQHGVGYWLGGGCLYCRGALFFTLSTL